MIRPAANSTSIKPIRRITKTIPPIIIRASGRYNTSLIRIWIRPLAKGKHFLFFLTPITKISVAAVKNALRNHYQGTSHDPYASHNPQEPWRPISVFRTQESHILQVRPKLPQAIGNVEYIAYGMPSLSVYLPYYQGMRHYQPGR